MTTVATKYGDVVVLSVDSEFSGDTVSQFRRVCQEQMEGDDSLWYVLDFEKTVDLDSGGLEALLWFRDEVEARTGLVKVCNLNETCAKVFELTRFDRKFEVFETLPDAIKSYD
jgi:anti-sigma B factor antagonist